ncbi:beta-galactosidase [Streptomyces sp. NPDC005799]|uniref:beta-galactosidase n=1 Tax=Streptomyces sp. NPDC005799 TaxID=3154678 RepID=UPI0033D402B8
MSLAKRWRTALAGLASTLLPTVWSGEFHYWRLPSPYDFSGVRDVDKLLDMAQDAGLYVIARPGPYINAETDGGGFPGWLMPQNGRARSTVVVSDGGDGNALDHADWADARLSRGGGA